MEAQLKKSVDRTVGPPSSGRSALPAGSKFLIVFWTAAFLAPWVFYALNCPSTGWDFPVFYIAGKLPAGSLYHREAFEEYWRLHLQPLGSPHWAAYVRPAFFSLLLRPLAAIPYNAALWAWLLAGTTVYFGALVLVLRRFNASLLLLPAFAMYFPAILGIIGGGDIAFYLGALIVALLLLERGHETAAALCLVLCLCKFNLVLLVPVMLALQRRGKALLAFVFGAILVAGASLLVSPLYDYVDAVSRAQQETAGFFPVGLRGAATGLGYAWSYPILVLATVLTCVWLMRRLPIADALAVAITGSLMISPYVCWYDSMLLAFPLIALWNRAGRPLRVVLVLTILAVPLWLNGGGYMQRPGGYMHVGVEVAILGLYARLAVRRGSTATESPLSLSLPASFREACHT
jgi:hypothetical protein